MKKEIFTLWVKDELVKRGHAIFREKKHKKVAGYTVWVFDETPEFTQDLIAITKK